MTTRTLMLTTCLLAAASPVPAVHAQQPRQQTQAQFEADLKAIDALAQTPRPGQAPRAGTPPAAPAAPQAPQVPQTPQVPQAPQVAVTPRRSGQPINIKIELTITDQRGGTAPLKKTVTVVTGDGLSGSLRSTASFSNIGDVPLNVDAEPSILDNGKIRLGFSLQYDLPSPSAQESRGPYQLQRTNIRESMNVILESGKAITVAQSADPISDRQVTVEVMATVLK